MFVPGCRNNAPVVCFGVLTCYLRACGEFFARAAAGLALMILTAGCSTGAISDTRVHAGPSSGMYSADFESVTNSDVTWAASADGLNPQFNVYMEQLLSKLESECRSGSRNLVLNSAKYCLDDPRRFALAHVVLTLLSGTPYETTEHSWNGLEFVGDATTGLQPRERAGEQIKQMWGPVVF
jgi:hypothetical protein